MLFNSMAVFFLISLFLVALLQVHIFEIAFAKLGLSPETTLFLLVSTLLGSGINLPIYSMPSKQSGHFAESSQGKRVWEIYQPAKEGLTVIAVNVGGCLIPVGLCLYFISLQLLDPIKLLLALSVTTALSYNFSRLMPGMGVGMPFFLAPLISAVLAVAIDPEHAAHLAYISGVLGVLIGADLFRLKDIGNLGAPIAAIGGAGTFDGIFMTGIIAAILA